MLCCSTRDNSEDWIRENGENGGERKSAAAYLMFWQVWPVFEQVLLT